MALAGHCAKAQDFLKGEGKGEGETGDGQSGDAIG